MTDFIPLHEFNGDDYDATVYVRVNGEYVYSVYAGSARTPLAAQRKAEEEAAILARRARNVAAAEQAELALEQRAAVLDSQAALAELRAA